MSWNKEKILFAVAVVVAVLVTANAVVEVGARGDSGLSYNPVDYRTGGKLPSSRLDLSWVEIRKISDARNPFEMVSDWAGAERDDLPPPPLDGLKRRVPLPALLAQSREALPPRESRMPKEEQ